MDDIIFLSKQLLLIIAKYINSLNSIFIEKIWFDKKWRICTSLLFVSEKWRSQLSPHHLLYHLSPPPIHLLFSLQLNSSIKVFPPLHNMLVGSSLSTLIQYFLPLYLNTHFLFILLARKISFTYLVKMKPWFAHIYCIAMF